MVQAITDEEWRRLEDLDGYEFTREDGYWWKLGFKRVVPSPAYPYGLSYELTLHAPSNHRIFGYDNAHPVKGTKRYSGRRTEHDHMHKTESDKGTPYDFGTSDTLITDFFDRIEQVIESHKSAPKL